MSTLRFFGLDSCHASALAIWSGTSTAGYAVAQDWMRASGRFTNLPLPGSKAGFGAGGGRVAAGAIGVALGSSWLMVNGLWLALRSLPGSVSASEPDRFPSGLGLLPPRIPFARALAAKAL